MVSLNQLTIPPVDQGATNGLVREKRDRKHKKWDININTVYRSGSAAETVLQLHQILKAARDQICLIP